MHSPKPRQVQRPAILNQPSSQSSSSLRGLERAIPSFQTFIKQTPPPPGSSKPLPPVPASTNPTIKRRSSSVYSRTISHWAPTPESWQSRDLEKADIFLKPNRFSYSTPQLHGRPETPPLLLPRTYSPLLDSPDMTPLHTPSPGLQPRPSILLPPPPPLAHVTPRGHHVKTVSLDKAQATNTSAGKIQLLPEEMRALATGKKRVRQSLRQSRSTDDLVPVPVLELPTTTPYLTETFYTPDNPYEIQKKAYHDVYRRDSGDSGISFENRGRQTERSTLKNQYLKEPTLRGPPQPRTVPLEKSTSDSRQLASAYHALLSDTAYDEGSRVTAESQRNVGSDIRLVPQPLFFNPRQISEQRTRMYKERRLYESPDKQTKASLQQRRKSSAEAASEHILQLALGSQSSGLRRKSTSGSIPISPPLTTESASSPTPLLGRFASPSPHARARKESPHLYKASARSPASNKKYEASVSASKASSSMTSSMKPMPLHRRQLSDGSSNNSLRSVGNAIEGLPGSVARRIAAVKGAWSGKKGRSDDTLASGSAQSQPTFFDLKDVEPSRASQSRSAKAAEPSWNWLKEPATTALRKASFVTDFAESRRLDKDSKRREQLKKMIRVVPEAGQGEPI